MTRHTIWAYWTPTFSTTDFENFLQKAVGEIFLYFMLPYNMVVSNHSHSVKILLFSSARSRDFDGSPGTELPVSMYTTKTPNRYVPF